MDLGLRWDSPNSTKPNIESFAATNISGIAGQRRDIRLYVRKNRYHLMITLSNLHIARRVIFAKPGRESNIIDTISEL